MDSWSPHLTVLGTKTEAWALVGIGIAGFYWLLSTAVQWYRLRHIPGPFICSVTSLWAWWWMKAVDFDTFVFNTQMKYGKITRITPTGVMVYDPDTVWRLNSARSAYTRGEWYRAMKFNPWGGTVLNEMDASTHDKRKAKLISGFSGKGLMDLEGSVDSQLAILVDILKSRIKSGQGQAVLDISRMLHHWQVDLVTLAGLGQSWENLPLNKDHYGYLKEGRDLIPFTHAAAMVPLLRQVFFSQTFLRLFGPSLTKGWLGALHKTVTEQMNGDTDKSNPENMLSTWLKHGLSSNDAEWDLAILLPAGTDTSISTIRAILMYLIISPNVYLKLKQEIADAIQRGRISNPVTNEEAKGLPYLQAVLSEGTRVAPPVTAGFPKVVPPGGDVILGEALPAGTEVYTNICALMKNPEVFGDDADSFRPERFLECDDATRSRRMKTVDLIFGYGRWLCLGKVLALMEMNKIFVELLRSFDFQLPNPEKPWSRRASITYFIEDFHIRVTENPIG